MIDGTTFSTEEAESLGLIHMQLGDAVEEEKNGKTRKRPGLTRTQFLEAVISKAKTYCAPDKAGMAVGHIKRAVQSGGDCPWKRVGPRTRITGKALL